MVPSGDGCVDPSGLAACVKEADRATDTCASNCDQSSSEYSECYGGCGIGQHEEYIACFVQSCWNQVS
jgi:hypothetical protein